MKIGVESNLLRSLFKNVYFINGTAYAGKSTAVKNLAEHYGGISCGENYHDALTSLVDPEHQPNLCYFQTMSGWEEFLNRTPEQYAAWIDGTSREAAELEILHLIRLSQQDKPIFVVTSRAGVLEQYRRSNLTLKTAIRVALRYRLRYPAIPLWFVTTLMQPKVYTLFASRSRYFYPRKGYTMPTAHQSVLELMHRYKSQVHKRGQGIYVAPALMPKVTPDQLIRLRKRSDVHYQFFMQHVPDYFDGKGLMCVCRLDFKTISETIMNLAYGKSVH